MRTFTFDDGEHKLRGSLGAFADENELGVVAVGVSSGQEKPGVDLGSAALLGSGILERLLAGRPSLNIHHDFTVHTYQDVMPPALPDELTDASSVSSESGSSTTSYMKRSHEVSHATHCLCEQVYHHARRGRTVLTLGGDHSLAIGSVAGIAKACRERLDKDLAVIWVDAHADINTPEISNSGNIHGMPVAFLTSISKTSDIEPFGWLESTYEGRAEAAIDKKKLVYIGLRDVEPEEQKLLDQYGIKAFSNKDVQRLGVQKVMIDAFEHIGPEVPIHLSFDIDSLDPSLAPSTGTPVTDGLTLEQGFHICGTIRDTGNLVSMDLVEVNPLENNEQANAVKTVLAAMTIIESALL